MAESKYSLKRNTSKNSSLVLGCMGFGGNGKTIIREDIDRTNQIIDVALSLGITLFDHADIYNAGRAEQVFGEVLQARPELRELITIQSKCGIRFQDQYGPQRYDNSAEWIIESAESSLKRLHIEQLDILMLHRPDPLMQPAEIARAFDQLSADGKVKQFGVSNMQHHQIAFLSSELSNPLVVNQVELSLQHLAWVEEGVTSGAANHPAVNYAAGTLEYCQQQGIQLQAWGSLCQGLFSGKDVSQQAIHVQQTAKLVEQLSAQYQVSKEAIVLAWLRRHPANIQPVIGTCNISRIKACAQVESVQLTREHWYALWLSARGNALP